MKLRPRLLIRPGEPAKLSEWDPADTLGFNKDKCRDALELNIARLDELQYLMFADHRHALLVVLQGMDASGKDGTIRHVMRGFNPQGTHVTAFKVPSPEEADHDFLWRVHRAVPGMGDTAIFNRSHYEDVLVARVRRLVPKGVWSVRYEQINEFERTLADNRVSIIKFFLHISKGEQKERFLERLRDPTKRWKVGPEDFSNRKLWSKYMAAYSDMLERCSTTWAPWYLVPANHKWFRNLVVSQIIVETLESLDMRFPKAPKELKRIRVD